MQVFILDEQGKLQPGMVEDPVISPSQLMIRVRAAGVNRADLLQKRGLYPPPPGESEIIGLEVAGEVCEVGSEVQEFGTGDRVMALLAGGGYSEYVAVHLGQVLPVHDVLSFEEAAAIPEAFLTAFQALFSIGNLVKGETVLVHAGASGVGSAAIQLARRAGARVVATVGTDEKVQFCSDLGADLTINYRSTSNFDETVKEKFGGADVVVDVVGGPYVKRNLSALNEDGRMVILAFMGGARDEIDVSEVLRKRIMIQGSTLRSRSTTYKAKLVTDFSHRFLEDFENGKLKPILDQVFPWGEVEKAHQMMKENRNMGKLVLKVN